MLHKFTIPVASVGSISSDLESLIEDGSVVIRELTEPETTRLISILAGQASRHMALLGSPDHDILLAARDSLLTRRGVVASGYRVVELVQPIPSGDHATVLGWADRLESGGWQFSDWSGEAKWTEDTLEAHRCDRCGVKSNRKRVYRVEHLGKVLQVGGSCAEQMGVSQRVEKLMRASIRINKIVRDVLEAEGLEWLTGVTADHVESVVAPARYVPSLILIGALVWMQPKLATVGEAFDSARVEVIPTYRAIGPQLAMLSELDRMGPSMPVDRLSELTQFRAELVPAVHAVCEEALPSMLAQIDAGVTAGNAFAATLQSAAVHGVSARILAPVVGAWIRVIRQYRTAKGVTEATQFNFEPTVQNDCPFTPDQIQQIESWFRGGNKRLNATDRKRMARLLPGVWRCESRRTVDGQFGTQTVIRFARIDGAVCTWFASGVKHAPDGAFALVGTVEPDCFRSYKGVCGGRKITRVEMIPLI